MLQCVLTHALSVAPLLSRRPHLVLGLSGALLGGGGGSLGHGSHQPASWSRCHLACNCASGSQADHAVCETTRPLQVQANDTLTSIAASLNTTVEAIIGLNEDVLPASNVPKQGTYLRLPGW